MPKARKTSRVILDEIVNEDSAEDGTISLEDKYAAQMRQIHPQKIELPISALRQMVEDQITLNPDFQRRDRWDNKKRSRLIESIIMNVPIPPVFLGEDKYGSYVVLDGRQRLTAVYEFLRNSYELENLTVWKELNGLRYSDLEDRELAPIIRRRFIPAILLLKESSPEVKYDVFDRLNTGGVTANQMEIRNAVFQGRFNRLIHELADTPQFLECWGLPADPVARKDNALYAQMGDLQLILRFFALREPESMRGSFKWYLGNYMDERNKAADIDPTILDKDRAAFVKALNFATRVFGTESAFARTDTGVKSAPMWDAIMVALSEIAQPSLSDAEAEIISHGIADLCSKDKAFRKAISQGTNGKGAISTRIGKARELLNKNGIL